MKIPSLIKHSDELMKISEKVAVGITHVMESLPEDGAWDLESKLRYLSTDTISDIAYACGTYEPQNSLSRLGHARGTLFEVMAIIKLGHRTKKLYFQPELMLDIKKTIELIDTEAVGLPESAEAWLNKMKPREKQASKNE